jgi:hypothetical protein
MIKMIKFKIIGLLLVFLLVPSLFAYDTLYSTGSNFTFDIYDTPQFDSFTIDTNNITFINLNLNNYTILNYSNNATIYPVNSGILNITFNQTNRHYFIISQIINYIFGYQIIIEPISGEFHSNKILGFIRPFSY